MTGGASLEAHGAMLEGKWTSLIAVAAQAPRFIGGETLRHRRPDAAVRIVAIDAAHRAFGKFVVSGPLKLRPHIDVTRGALLIDRDRLAHHQRVPVVGVNLVTRGAGDLILGMTALQSAHVRGLVQVTGQADFIGSGRGELGGIANVGGVGRFGMLLSRSMAGFAGSALPLMFRIAFYGGTFRGCGTLGHDVQTVVRSLGEGLEDIFVTGSASFRSGVWRFSGSGSGSGRGRRRGVCPAAQLTIVSTSQKASVLRMHLVDCKRRTR